MGQKQSKGKGKGKGKQDEPAASTPNNEAPASSKPAESAAAPPKEVKKEDSGVDWDAQTLYSGDNKKVTKDDFELLKVIGKGSFGKVSSKKFLSTTFLWYNTFNNTVNLLTKPFF